MRSDRKICRVHGNRHYPFCGTDGNVVVTMFLPQIVVVLAIALHIGIAITALTNKNKGAMPGEKDDFIGLLAILLAVTSLADGTIQYFGW